MWCLVGNGRVMIVGHDVVTVFVFGIGLAGGFGYVHNQDPRAGGGAAIQRRQMTKRSCRGRRRRQVPPFVQNGK
jgi:uncharacterized membrane protein